MPMLKKTSLNQAHRDLGARMVDFGGWDMPVVYTNQIEEHHAVRQKAGLFDVSHMGEIMISGADAFALVQKLVSKDITDMAAGKMILGVMCTEQGGIIDDLTVYKYADDKYMLVVNAGTLPADLEHIIQQSLAYKTTVVEDISDRTSKLDIQGPKAQEILQRLSDIYLAKVKRYWFREVTVDGVAITISRSGYTGEDGFELYFDNAYAVQIWNKLLEVGKDDGLIPCGLGARDTLRTECGMMLYGHDIDLDHSPLEAVYGWACSLDKNFIGKEALLQQQHQGLKRKIVGFEMLDRGIARQHYPIFFGSEQVGEVTSGTPSPTLGKNIGMGYVRSDLIEPGTELEIEIRGKRTMAKVVALPFYIPAYKR
ncbi:MAG: glycine cleavage system aminomethyltransferase GcvT [bacterium]|nr:glycine cleavage system aminomethyltransferase GcvT [bacterium]